MSLEWSTDIAPLYATIAGRFSETGMGIPTIGRRYAEDLFRHTRRASPYHLLDRGGALTGAVAVQEYRRFLLRVGTPRIESTHAANEYPRCLPLWRAQAGGYRTFENAGTNTPGRLLRRPILRGPRPRSGVSG
jgi:hypothetical protein